MCFIYVDFSIPGLTVTKVLDSVGGLPNIFNIDKGSEFTGKAIDQWAHEKKIKLDSFRPGKPNENAIVESFNGKFRNEYLNENWFLRL